MPARPPSCFRAAPVLGGHLRRIIKVVYTHRCPLLEDDRGFLTELANDVNDERILPLDREKFRGPQVKMSVLARRSEMFVIQNTLFATKF